MAASANSWTDTAVVVQVPLGATSGPVAVSAAGLSTQEGIPFTVIPALGPVTSISVTPSALSMLAGDTRNLTVTDNNGQVASGVSWATSDSSTASFDVSTGLLTANNAGSATLTATYQGFTSEAAVTVYGGANFPAGAVMWSGQPTANGYSNWKTIQATPTGTNLADMFAVDTQGIGPGLYSASVRALTVDGQQPFVSVLGNADPYSFVPDRSGGLVFSPVVAAPGAINKYYLARMDGNTGRLAWLYGPIAQDAAYTQLTPITVHPNGTILALASPGGVNSDHTALVALDGTTGQLKYTVPLPSNAFGGLSLPSVMPDGTVDLVVGQCTEDYSSETVSLFKIQVSGAFVQQTVKSVTGGSCPYYVAGVIPDGQGGVLASWSNCADYCFANSPTVGVFHVDSAGNTTTIPLPVTNPQRFNSGLVQQRLFLGASLVLGDNHTAFFTDTVDIVAFNVNTGIPLWTWATTTPPVSFIGASDGQGLVTVVGSESTPSGRADSQTVIRFDASGNRTSDSWTSTAAANAGASGLTNIDHFASDAFSVTGVDSNGNLLRSTMISSGQPVTVAATAWPRLSGNRQHNRSPNLPEVVTFLPSHLGFPPSPPYDVPNFYTDMLGTVPSISEKNTGPTPANARAIQRFFGGNDAQVQKFRGELSRPLDALSFVGHGVVKNEGESSEFSYGLWFYYPASNPPFADPTAPFDKIYNYSDANGNQVTQTLPYEPNWNDHKLLSLEEDATKLVGLSSSWRYRNSQWAIEYPSFFLAGKLAPQAKIMFFGACSLNPSFGFPGEISPFVQMWDVHDLSIDGTVEMRVRAMIVPNVQIGSTVPLAEAAAAWVKILNHLVHGSTVGEAVSAANNETPPSTVKFKVLGNHGVKLTSE
jgi:hypothetical protein